MSLKSYILRPAAAALALQFPALLESKHVPGFVVLLISETAGTIVADPTEYPCVGMYFETFDISNFKPFDDTIVLGKPIDPIPGLSAQEITAEAIDLGTVDGFAERDPQATSDNPIESEDVQQAIGLLIEAITATGVNVAGLEISVLRQKA